MRASAPIILHLCQFDLILTVVFPVHHSLCQYLELNFEDEVKTAEELAADFGRSKPLCRQYAQRPNWKVRQILGSWDVPDLTAKTLIPHIRFPVDPLTARRAQSLGRHAEENQ